MSFNVSKCKTMIISRKKNHGSSFPTLILNGSILDAVPTFIYLGVLFLSNLSWSDHIQGVCSKAHKILGLLYRRYYISVFRQQKSAPTVYISCLPAFRLCCTSMGPPLAKRTLSRLRVCKKFALKIIMFKAMGSRL